MGLDPASLECREKHLVTDATRHTGLVDLDENAIIRLGRDGGAIEQRRNSRCERSERDEDGGEGFHIEVDVLEMLEGSKDLKDEERSCYFPRLYT